MIPSLPIQKTQNKLAVVSLILVLSSILAAALLHFFLYLFPGVLTDTLLNLFIATPVVIGAIGIILGVAALGRIRNNNYFGRGKAITGIVLGCLVLVGLVIFLVLLFS